jgi:hypothetical protein
VVPYSVEMFGICSLCHCELECWRKLTSSRFVPLSSWFAPLEMSNLSLYSFMRKTPFRRCAQQHARRWSLSGCSICLRSV